MNTNSMRFLLASLFMVLLSGQCYAKNVGIHGAARAGDLARVKKYLADDPKLISSRDGAGRTPLTAAAIGGQKEMVEFLITQGADVNDKGFMEMSPLADMAAGWGQRDDKKCAEIAKVLLSHGGHVNDADNRYGTTALGRAAESGKKMLVQLLLEKGADVNLTHDVMGYTPLHLAAMNGRRDIVEILVNAKARLDVKDRNTLTPLREAEFCKNPEVVEYLKSVGASE